MKKILCYMVLAVLLGLSQATHSSAFTLGFSANGANSWDVNLYGVNIINLNQIITAYDLDVTYTSNTPVNVIFGTRLGTPGDMTDVFVNGTAETVSLFDLTTTPGTIDLFQQPVVPSQNDLFNLQNGLINLTLATLVFQNPGDPGLSFANWYNGPGSVYPNINDIKGYNGAQLYPVVPEPGTMLLLGSGIAALVPFRRRILRQKN